MRAIRYASTCSLARTSNAVDAEPLLNRITREDANYDKNIKDYLALAHAEEKTRG